MSDFIQDWTIKAVLFFSKISDLHNSGLYLKFFDLLNLNIDLPPSASLSVDQIPRLPEPKSRRIMLKKVT